MSITGEAEECFLAIRGDCTKKRPRSLMHTQLQISGRKDRQREREKPAGRAGVCNAPLSATDIISEEKSLRTRKK